MTKKSELSLMWQMKIEAERDFHKFIKYVAELEKENEELKKENKELKARIAEYDDLTEELDFRKREAKRLWWNAKDSASTITKIIDGPITYTKDSTWKWVADGEPPIVLC